MYSQKDIDRFWAKVEKTDTCWNWTAGKTTDGYGRFSFQYKTVGAHRFSFVLKHNTLIDDGMCILHSCNNPSCVNPSHLSQGTNDENMKYMVETGQSCRGSDVNTSKLTKEQVDEIRHKYANTTTTYRKLGKEYGVCFSAIGRIIKGINWKHTFNN
jgi:hypothetical protein